MRVVAAARSTERLNELVAEIAAAGGEALAFPADLRTAAAAPAGIAATLQRFGHIDLLVNNAGATARGDFLTLTDVQWEDGYSLKFFGAMRLCRVAWPYLMASRGSIVNIAGIGGKLASGEFAIGGSVNAALMFLTKSLADRGVQDGVRVNAINPGYIQTARLQKRLANLAEQKKISLGDAAAETTAAVRIARFGQPSEIADLVAFLASERSSYLQGAVVDADGGQNRGL
jgi:NAD(P)-dependent dehydrogenase (short-subunit alcohol dehydrogenase family)